MTNQSMNVTSKIFLINKNTVKLKELKKIIESPNVFISEYFSQLVNDVDLESEILLLDRKSRNTFKKQQEITKNREIMVDHIKKIESECLNSTEKKFNDDILEEAKNLIEIMDSELILKKSIEELEAIEKHLDTELHKLKAILFQNKSFTFLKKQQIANYNNDDGVTFGKLIFMNHYLSPSGLELFQQKLNQTTQTTKEINNDVNHELSDELIKVWYLTREIKQNYSENMIINIDLNGLHNLECLNFFNEGFTTINANTFTHFKFAKNLNLNANNLKKVDGNAFNGLDKLEVLNLSNNSPQLFTTVEADAFMGLNNLVGLNLSNHNNNCVSDDNNETPNEKEAVALKNKDLFANLKSLHYLELFNNNIIQIEPECFKSLSSLIYLDLSENGLTSIDPLCFEGLPSLVELNLTRNRLTSIELDDFYRLINLKTLRLSQNQIRSVTGLGTDSNKPRRFLKIEDIYLDKNNLISLKKETFQNLTTLKTLNLAFNSICILDLEAFTSLTHLSNLNLSNNSVTQLDKHLFKTLKSLEVLDLKNNLLEAINPGQFLTNSRLKSLNLESNRIQKLGDTEGAQDAEPTPDLSAFSSFSYWNRMSDLSLEPRTGPFRRLYNLEDLNLSNNQLSLLKNDYFMGLDNLKTLDLATNHINSIEPLAFRLLRSLKHLNLGSNQLSKLDTTQFKNLFGLEKIYLNNNHLVNVAAEQFRDQSHLKILCLDYNKIESIEARSLFNLKNLVTLNLESNKLTELDERTFDSLEKLTTLVLTNNQFSEDEVEKLKKTNGQRVLI